MTSGSWTFIFSVMIFFGFLALMNTLLPANLQFVSSFDFLWFGGNIITVAGACVLATGIPCAAALAIFGVGTFFAYIFVTFDALKLVIFLPIVITLIFILSQLARGSNS